MTLSVQVFVCWDGQVDAYNRMRVITGEGIAFGRAFMEDPTFEVALGHGSVDHAVHHCRIKGEGQLLYAD